MSCLISLNSLLLEDIACDGSFKLFVFVIVFVFVFVCVFVIVIVIDCRVKSKDIVLFGKLLNF